MVEGTITVFMDDFSVMSDTFDDFLAHLSSVLERYEKCNLVLNRDKCHFIVKEKIVLGHKISKKGIKFDKVKIKVIEKLPPSIFKKAIQSF